MSEALRLDRQRLKTQTAFSLSLDGVRRAAAAYEMVKAANIMLETLPLPVLEALRDYAAEQVRNRNSPLLLCERHYVEHLDELIKQTKLDERRLLEGITGVVPPERKENDKPSHVG
ncbi:MAG TPA: hypothetical protein VKC66_06790 [Xanthobacteraceae bacterium]|nr:hypothetical protein [Xanthobacteraceae bacterium]